MIMLASQTMWQLNVPLAEAHKPKAGTAEDFALSSPDLQQVRGSREAQMEWEGRL